MPGIRSQLEPNHRPAESAALYGYDACLPVFLRGFIVLGKQSRAGPTRSLSRYPVRRHPGPLNAITDIAGIDVGRTTLIEGNPDSERRDTAASQRPQVGSVYNTSVL